MFFHPENWKENKNPERELAGGITEVTGEMKN